MLCYSLLIEEQYFTYSKIRLKGLKHKGSSVMPSAENTFEVKPVMYSNFPASGTDKGLQSPGFFLFEELQTTSQENMFIFFSNPNLTEHM